MSGKCNCVAYFLFRHPVLDIPDATDEKQANDLEVAIADTSLGHLFLHTVMDLIQLRGQVYLAYVDRCTGWLDVDHLPNGAMSSKTQIFLY